MAQAVAHPSERWHFLPTDEEIRATTALLPHKVPNGIVINPWTTEALPPIQAPILRAFTAALKDNGFSGELKLKLNTLWEDVVLLNGSQ